MHQLARNPLLTVNFADQFNRLQIVHLSEALTEIALGIRYVVWKRHERNNQIIEGTTCPLPFSLKKIWVLAFGIKNATGDMQIIN